MTLGWSMNLRKEGKKSELPKSKKERKIVKREGKDVWFILKFAGKEEETRLRKRTVERGRMVTYSINK